MPSHTHMRFTPTDPQTPVQALMLKVKTHVKAGALTTNHNETLVQAPRPAAALRVKTHLKAGGLTTNHNETLVQAPRPAVGLQVKTHIKAGLAMNYMRKSGE